MAIEMGTADKAAIVNVEALSVWDPKIRRGISETAEFVAPNPRFRRRFEKHGDAFYHGL